jgi:hypothetical protein
MAANQKIELQSQSLMERLGLRLSTTVAKSYVSGDVMLTVSVGDDADALILMAPIAPLASGSVDALGLTQRVYSPHIIKVIFDTTAVTGAASATKLAILGELFRTGMKLELYEVDCSAKDGGAAVLASTDFVAANFIASFDSLEWGTLASV